MDIDFVVLLLYYGIKRREMLAAIRSRKANIMRDREAALARLNDHPENDFKRRFRMRRYQFDILVTILLC